MPWDFMVLTMMKQLVPLRYLRPFCTRVTSLLLHYPTLNANLTSETGVAELFNFLLHADKKVNRVWSIFQAKVDENLSKLFFISWLFRIVLNSCNLSTNIWQNRWNDSYIVIESLSMENCWSKKTIILWLTIVQLGGRYTVIPSKLLEFRGA